MSIFGDFTKALTLEQALQSVQTELSALNLAVKGDPKIDPRVNEYTRGYRDALLRMKGIISELQNEPTPTTTTPSDSSEHPEPVSFSAGSGGF